MSITRLDRAIAEITAIRKSDEDAIYGDDQKNKADLMAISEAIFALNRQATLTKFTSEERLKFKRAAHSLQYVLIELEHRND